MSLISLQNITLSFGGPPILQQINLQIEPGERVCLIGRNGEGKSSLMKLIAGDLKPDSGNIIRQQGLRVARLSQDVPLDLNGSVIEVVAGGLGELQKLLTQYHDILVCLSSGGGENLLTKMGTVQHQLETAGGWQAQQRVETVISRLQLNTELWGIDILISCPLSIYQYPSPMGPPVLCQYINTRPPWVPEATCKNPLQVQKEGKA